MKKRVKDARGFGIVAGVVTAAIVSGIALIVVNSNNKFAKITTHAQFEKNFQVLENSIINTVRYENSCKEGFLDYLNTSGILGQLISSKKSTVEIKLINGEIVKSNKIVEEFLINVSELSVDNFLKVESRYSLDFYSGDVVINYESSHHFLKNKTAQKTKKLINVAVLVDPASNKAIACAGKLDQLVDNQEFQTKKNNSLNAIASNPDAAKNDINVLLNQLSKDTGKVVTINDLPSPDQIPEPTASCGTVCQTIKSYYTRNGYSNPESRTAEFTKYVESQDNGKNSLERLVNSYNSVYNIVTTSGGTDQTLDNFMARQNYSSEQNIGYVSAALNAYTDAVNAGNTVTQTVLTYGAAEGYSAQVIVENYQRVVTDISNRGYTQEQVSNYFNSGGTLAQAYAQGLLP